MKYITILALAAFTCVPKALAQEGTSPRPLRDVVVTGHRPMKDIGVQKTALDSLALKENVALSMADVLTFNSSVFVKSYGRATLSTVSFRGTSPSHTQVTWNGMRINNPMLGMTDFSTIPSYFVDQATLLHGTSSVSDAGGGLGGLVRLATAPPTEPGLHVRYVQGVGSFRTFDEFAHLAYANDRWSLSTRIAYSSSPNDYKFVNHDKKVNVYDEAHHIVSQYHPVERNRSGAFKDFHLLQEAYCHTREGDRWGTSIWYVNSNRELAMLSTDYGHAADFENRQREQTLRAVMSWNRNDQNWKTEARGGYVHTWMAYDYRRETTPGLWAVMTRSRSKVNTFYGQMNGEYSPSHSLYFTADASVHQHFVRSQDKNVILQDGNRAIVGYDQGRTELSASASAKWQPVKPIGLSLVLRQEMFGNAWAVPIPALFADGRISKKGNVILKMSISRNHRFPTLNDLYFLPGGNPDLRPERGWSYDGGISFDVARKGTFPFSISGSLTGFDSHIDDWILWLPTTKGFFSPRNVKSVHAYGMETRLHASLAPLPHGLLSLNASYSYTPSLNESAPTSPADQSVGKQLPYVPRHSASLTARMDWRTWAFLYKWAYYSERHTMTSNDHSLTGYLPPYFMSNVSLEKSLALKPANIQLKLAVNNLFDEDYLSVLSRPMPGRNFELFVSVTPKMNKKGSASR